METLKRRTMLGAWRIRWDRHCACCDARVWHVVRWVRGSGWVSPEKRRSAKFQTYGTALAELWRRSPASARAMPPVRATEERFLCAYPYVGKRLPDGRCGLCGRKLRGSGEWWTCAYDGTRSPRVVCPRGSHLSLDGSYDCPKCERHIVSGCVQRVRS